jgi:hypothetical protein
MLEWWQAGLAGVLGSAILTLGEAIGATDRWLQILREGGREDPRLKVHEFSRDYATVWSIGQLLRSLAAAAVVPVLGEAGFDRTLPAVTLGITVALAGRKVASLLLHDQRDSR